MTTVGDIGVGLLILLILWIVTIIIFVVGIKLQSNIAWIALGLSSVLTLVLLCIPTEKQYDVIETEFVGYQTSRFVQACLGFYKSFYYVQEKDFIIVYKTSILTFLIASALAGLFVFFVSYCIEPIRPRPFKSFYDN